MQKTSFFDGGPLAVSIQSVRRCSAKCGVVSYPKRSLCELVYKLNGCSEQYFGSLKIDLVPDSVYFIPTGMDNTVNVTEPGDVILIQFSLLGNDVPSFPPELIEKEPGSRYRGLFFRALEVWQRKDASSYPEAAAAFYSILAGLAAEREQQYFSKSSFALIAPAVRYIREHYREPLTVGELAGLCGISDEYLRVLFTRLTGLPPYAYLNGLRLDAARELLSGGYVSVAEAAAQVGYDSPGYFSRQFKKRFGVPPSKLTHSAVPASERKSSLQSTGKE